MSVSFRPEDVRKHPFRRKFCHILQISLLYPHRQQNVFDFFWQIIFLRFRRFPPSLTASLLTSWQLQANTVARVLCWGDSSTARARHLRGNLCVHTLPTPPQPTCTSPVNTYGSEAYLLKTQGPALPCGSHRLFLLALHTHCKQPLIDVAEIWMSNWFWLPPHPPPLAGELGHLVGDALFRFN